MIKKSKTRFIGRVALSMILLVTLYSCRESLLDDLVSYENNISKNVEHKTRSVDEIKDLALSFYGIMGKENGLNASVTPDKSQLSLDVFTLDQVHGNDNSKLGAMASIDKIGKSKPSNDTLLYYVGLPGNGGMLLSGNEDSTPLLAILDDENFSFKEVLSDTENNEGVLSFLLTAAEYNKNPEAFGDALNTDETTGDSPKAFRIRWDFWRKRRNDPVPPQPVYLVDQVSPKVKVEWGQWSPYNKYTPNNYPAGCVATAIAQALTVTRHISNFEGIELNYNDLIKFKNSGWYYEINYPKQADIIGQLFSKIGEKVGMSYGPDESGANLNYAVQKIFIERGMRVNKNKASIKNLLKYYDRGIAIIGSRTKKNSFWGRPRGDGHAYIADGYLQYSNGSDLIHVNYGWGSGYKNDKKYNGYYLSNLMSPHWTGDAPEKFPHSWSFYCIY